MLYGSAIRSDLNLVRAVRVAGWDCILTDTCWRPYVGKTAFTFTIHIAIAKHYTRFIENHYLQRGDILVPVARYVVCHLECPSILNLYVSGRYRLELVLGFTISKSKYFDTLSSK